MARSIFAVLRGICNISFIVYNFVTVPPRNSEEHLNMSKHIVAWLELPICIGFAFALHQVFLVAVFGRPRAAALLSSNVRSCADFSLIRVLPMANPLTLAKHIRPILQNGWYWMALGQFLVTLWLLPAAVLCVVIKVEQVDFIATLPIPEWSPWEFFALAGFINNLSGIRGDTDLLKMYGALRLRRGTEENEAQLRVHLVQWRRELVEFNSSLFGFFAAVGIDLSLSADDICKLSSAAESLCDGDVLNSSATRLGIPTTE
ncbi:unnamed protein product [Symbiodinium sp. CCMP2592]|nr:unnamed protein product [Symbiodinium sp. CCMP2592]